MAFSSSFQPERIHEQLGADFYDPVEAARFPGHTIRHRDQRWAARTGLDTLTDEEWVAHFGRFEPLPGSLPLPLALRYHGHQFRTYNPDLGDGRGFLFAQCRDLEDGRLLDLGTKGSGQTPWSRTADGRLTLKGGVRELLATSMLEALGVNTSKAFSLIETGEELWRGDEPSPTRSAVLVRLSHSHIRIGSFQRLLFLDEHDNIVRLMDHTIRHYMPDAWRDDIGQRAVAFLRAVGGRVAETGARWMMAGFVHGVLNTDNINVTGESFDYGPWRFAPVLDPAFTAAYFDQTGLYAFGKQPDTLLWNMTRLAECLLHLAPQSELEAALNDFAAVFRERFNAAMLDRLGLAAGGDERDVALVGEVWRWLAASRAPFEQFMFDWRGGALSAQRALEGPSAAFYERSDFAAVRALIEAAAPLRPNIAAHAYFRRTTPCTMLIDEVEALWAPIAEADDWSALHAKLAQIEIMRDAYQASSNLQ